MRPMTLKPDPLGADIVAVAERLGGFQQSNVVHATRDASRQWPEQTIPSGRGSFFIGAFVLLEAPACDHGHDILELYRIRRESGTKVELTILELLSRLDT